MSITDELADLKSSVDRLIPESDENEQIKILQEIGKKLLTEYVIRIGDMIIEPLLVEAYYYNEEKFPDKCVHAASSSNGRIATQARRRQKKNFGKLYIHYARKMNDGIDICLSDGEFYLSFLIKNALVNKEWKTQSEISEEICRQCGKCNDVFGCIYDDEIILHRISSSPNPQEILYVPRKGVSGKFANKLLAALPVDCLCQRNFTLPKGYCKQWRCSMYALFHSDGKNECETREYAKELNKGKIEDEYWSLAKKSWSDNQKL